MSHACDYFGLCCSGQAVFPLYPLLCFLERKMLTRTFLASRNPDAMYIVTLNVRVCSRSHRTLAGVHLLYWGNSPIKGNNPGIDKRGRHQVRQNKHESVSAFLSHSDVLSVSNMTNISTYGCDVDACLGAVVHHSARTAVPDMLVAVRSCFLIVSQNISNQLLVVAFQSHLWNHLMFCSCVIIVRRCAILIHLFHFLLCTPFHWLWAKAQSEKWRKCSDMGKSLCSHSNKFPPQK